MKTVILSIMSLLLPVCVFAQFSLQKELNMFRAGDVTVKQQVGYKDPGRSGANVLWDFSRMEVIDDAHEVAYSSYNDTLITVSEYLSQSYYVLQEDSLLLWGFDNQATELHDVQPELLLKFPVHYGDTVGSFFYAHGKHGNRLELDAMGRTATAADSYGMMILPDGDTLRNVLRTHTLKYIVETVRPIGDEYYEKRDSPLRISPDSIDYRLASDSVVFISETFRWYSKGYRYPVFETVRSRERHPDNRNYEFMATAFFYPPQNHYYLDDDADNLALLEETTDTVSDAWAGLTYNIFPNPVRDSGLDVEMYLPKNVNSIRVQLHGSMGLIVYNEDKSSCSAGIYSFQIPVGSLPIGNYILDIWLDEKQISEIIMKR